MSTSVVGPTSGSSSAVSRQEERPISIALQCIREVGLTLACTAIVSCFVATPLGLTLLLKAAILQLAATLCFQCMAAGFRRSGSPNWASFCEWMASASFILTALNSQMLIHETGHAAAASLVYQNAQPRIQLEPFLGGITHFSKNAMTSFGKQIGPVRSTFFVIASGPALTLLISSIFFVIGLAIQKKHPQFGKHLIAWALADFTNHAIYALSSLLTNPYNLAHDFAHLSVLGLSPIVAAIGILAIPLLLRTGTYLASQRYCT